MTIKKLGMVALAVLLCLSLSITSFATEESADSKQIEICFDELDYEGLSGVELGRAKLLESGHSQDFINTMPESTLEKVALSVDGYQVKSYMKEIKTDNGTELVEIAEDEFRSNLEQTQAFDPSNIEVVDEKGNVLTNTVTPINVTESVDGGTVYVITTFYSVEDASNPSHFLVVSEFIWTSMPEYRGTDFFGITRDNYVSLYPNSFGNYYAYEYDRYWYLATNGGVMSSYMDTTSVEYTDIENEDDYGHGFAIKMTVPGDVLPPSSMFVGQNAYGLFCYAFRGGCYFEGTLAQPSIVPTYFNIITTYLHQTGTRIFYSPSITIPIGASIEIDKEKYYAPKIVDTILVKWGS